MFSFKSLDLKNNKIQATAGVYVADLIKANRTLKKIDLKWNDLGKQGV